MTFSLKTRLALTYSLLILFAAVLLSAGIGYFTTKRLQTTIGESLGDLAFTIGDRLDRDMFYRYRDLAAMATIATSQGRRGETLIDREWLEELQHSFPYYKWIGFADPEGRILVSTGRLLEGASVAERPWFQGARQRPYFGDVHKALMLESLLPEQNSPLRFVDVAVPVRDEASRFAGVLGAHMSWQWTREVQASVLDVATHTGPVEVLIVGIDGDVLLGPDALQGQTIELPELGTEPTHAVQSFADGDRYLAGMVVTPGHRDFPGLGWRIVVRQDLGSAFAPVRAQQIQIFLWGFIIALLFFGASWWTARRITAPLRAISATAEKLRRGESGASFPDNAGYREGQTLINSLSGLTSQLMEREQSLREQEERFRHTFEQAAVGIAHVDLDGRWLRVNRRLCEILGYSPEQLQQLRFQDISLADELDEGLSRMNRLTAGDIATYSLEKRYRRGDGTVIWANLTVAMRRDPDGRPLHFISVIEDISRRKHTESQLQQAYEELEQRVDARTAELLQANHSLRASETRLQTITDSLPALIAYVDRDERSQFHNATYRNWYGLESSDIQGRKIASVHGDAFYRRIEPYVRRALAGERVSFDRKESGVDGAVRYAHATYIPDFRAAGEVAGFYVTVVDITARKLLEMHLQHQNDHDVLTGLPNRTGLTQHLEMALARTRRHHGQMAVMFLDLDRFKQVNDTQGHAAGDELLKQVAGRLTAAVRKTDTVGRLAGDEFVVILEGVSNDRDHVAAVAAKIIDTMAAPFDLAGTPAVVTTSIGVAMCRADDDTVDSLLTRADIAMYDAKQQGRNCFRLAP